ncbi:taurine ABC transporter substrate-binding protein [Cohnella abietis]|uniref:Taurine ABC transporter substrate-binding protein n=1 Tax=Cohnella abietis TaxID=2507935 RepID=A0A3T1D5G6_9BACL|nr:ABC transporter substrate-binding protein [Cohnella abietis]BBI33352.1 taurine ABC transporter substrate-binding protein [Cohnella abietis]
MLDSHVNHKKQINKWTVSTLLVALSMLLLLAGCGSDRKDTTDSQGKARKKVVIGYLAMSDPQAAAAQLGFFHKHMDADITFQRFDSGPASLAALAAGSIQFMTELGNPPTANAISKGIPIEVIWLLEQYTTGVGLVVKENSSIHSLADLKGKKLAVVKGSTGDLVLSTALQSAGINASSIDIINMSPPNMVSAWKSGNIEAAITWDPAKSEMLNDGGRVILYAKDQEAPVVNLVVVNKKWAASHKHLVEGFVKAEVEGIEFFEKSPDEAHAAIAQWNSIAVDDVKERLKGINYVSLKDQLTPIGMGDDDAAQSIVQKALEMALQDGYKQGQIETIPDNIDAFINRSYVKSILDLKP